MALGDPVTVVLKVSAYQPSEQAVLLGTVGTTKDGSVRSASVLAHVPDAGMYQRMRSEVRPGESVSVTIVNDRKPSEGICNTLRSYEKLQVTAVA
jgi:hypothetical protein